MSQKVTLDVAMTLKKGDILYSNAITFGPEGDKTPATAKVTGKCKLLKGSVEIFQLPIKRLYCQNAEGFVTRMSQDIWRTDPEKKALPGRIHRTRPVPAPVAPARVRRVRSGFSAA